MIALSNAALAYGHLEGTSTIDPHYDLLDYVFRTRASTVYYEERELLEETIDAIGKLKSFSRLQENWDGYGALPPQQDTIEQAISFVKALDRGGEPVYFAAPGPNGEILVELKKGNRTVEVTIEEDNHIKSALFIENRCIEEDANFVERKILEWLR
ncbi:MAG: hypothetical protein NTV54_02630 [Ignavibacteriales bacterium]|nr:hypothetical protein [Ignavibacteriales bacterium]